MRGSNIGLGYVTGYTSTATLMATKVINPEDAVVYTNASSDKPLVSLLSTVVQALRIDVDPYNATSGGLRFDNKTKIFAQECVIMPCVRAMRAFVRQGAYSERVLDTYMKLDDSDTGVIRPPWGPDKGIQPGDDNTFGVSSDVLIGMLEDQYPERILTGNVTADDGGTGLLFTSDQLQNIYFANVSALETCPFTSPGRKDPFSCAINAVADAYTRTIRNAGYVANGTASLEGLAVGETLVTRTFIRVEWPWITLHVVVWLLTAVGWTGTVWRTKSLGIPFWRSNPMAIVYMYSAAQQLARGSTAESGSALGMDMETEGDDVLMRLRNEDGHVRLVSEGRDRQ